MRSARMRSKVFPFAFALGLATLGIQGCGDDDNNPVLPGEPSVIQGQVSGDAGYAGLISSSAGIEGATVTVAQVQASGTLVTVSRASVLTDAEGRFVVETDVDDVSQLMVVATKSTAEWKAVVSATARRGTTVRCQPLNDESTVEAEVFARVVSHGKAATVSYADIAAYVDMSVAAEVKGNVTATNQVALALEDQVAAEADYLMDASVGVSASAWSAIRAARLAAQIELESDLDIAGTSESAIAAAFEEASLADFEAYLDAGVKAQTYAKAREVSARAFVRATSSLSSDGRLAIARSVGKLRARAVDAAVQAQFTVLGASSTQLAIVAAAGTSLLGSVKSAGSAEAIAARFELYHGEILTELMLVAFAHAAAIASLDTDIRAEGGLRTTLAAQVAASSSVEDLVDAYIQFFTGVRVLVETSLQEISAEETEAIAEALVLLNMSV